MINDFIKQCDELDKKIKDVEIQKGVAESHIKESIAKLKELTEKLDALPVPVIDGEPVTRFKIDAEKLTQAAYVVQLNKMIPDVLSQLETTGMKLIAEATAN